MRQSPRIRRLRNDFLAMQELAEQSSIISFKSSRLVHGEAPDSYHVFFRGKGTWRHEPSGEILIREQHEVSIQLGAAYPRTMPELSWKSPIFHPNISAGGVVCLGGYSTHWTPSLSLSELCCMLWDMIRYHNYDVESPYNREAAHWARMQTQFPFPLDRRVSRNLVSQPHAAPESSPPIVARPQPSPEIPQADVVFLDDPADQVLEIVEAEVVAEDNAPGERDQDCDILFID